MLKHLVAVATSILAAATTAGVGENRVVQASGVSGQRAFQAAGFDRVELAGPFNVVVTVGGAHAVRAEGDTGLMEHLDIRTEGGLLLIGFENGYNFSGNHGQVTVHVTTPALSAADISGSGDMQVSPFRTRSFAGLVAGSGNLVLERVDADTASFEVAGSGNLRGSGSAGETRVEIVGSGNVRLAGLNANRTHVSVAGSGDAEVRAARDATVEIVGSGNVAVEGGARCSVTEIGSGRVRCG
jgi:hypothetical protein